MTKFTVDRCYDRYIVTMAMEDIEEGSTLETKLLLIRDILLAVIDGYRQSGQLRSVRIANDDAVLELDFESAPGQEDMLAAAVDVMMSAMAILADTYPDDVSVDA